MKNYKDAFAAILDSQGRICGAGVAVSAQFLLTCAHVVNAALGGRTVNETTPPDLLRKVHVTLPFARKGSQRALSEAVVHFWKPKPPILLPAHDFAILRLLGSAVVQQGRFVAPPSCVDHEFRVFGFPGGSSSGLWAGGTLIDEDSDGLIQIETNSDRHILIKPGFSGAPVWDKQENGIVGILRSTIADLNTVAHMVPVAAIRDAWPHFAIADPVPISWRSDPAMLDIPAPMEKDTKSELRVRQGGLDHLSPPSIIGRSVRSDLGDQFLDRGRHLLSLSDALASNEVTTIIVTGREGIGKSALVGRLLSRLEQNKLDRTPSCFDRFLYLSEISESLSVEDIFIGLGRLLQTAVTDTFSSARGKSASQSEPKRLIDKLALLYEQLAFCDLRVLLLLDGLDAHVSGNKLVNDDLGAFFEFFCTRNTSLKLLVTARTSFALSPRALRTVYHLPISQGLPQRESITLFRQLDPDGTRGLKASGLINLRQAARLTDGNPRAIELIASFLYGHPTLSLSDVLNEATLFAENIVEKLSAQVIATLSQHEQLILCAVSIFSEPVSSQAVRVALGPSFSPDDIKSTLNVLVRNNFVHYRHDTDHYHVRGSDKALIDRLVAQRAFPSNISDALVGFHSRASEYYFAHAQIGTDLVGKTTMLLLAAKHLIAAGNDRRSAELLDSVGTESVLSVRPTLLLAVRKSINMSALDPITKANHLLAIGQAYQEVGQLRLAIASYRNVLSVVPTDAVATKAKALCELSDCQRLQGHYQESLEIAEQALTAVANSDDDGLRMTALMLAGDASRRLGTFSTAIRYGEQALGLATSPRLEQRRQVANVYWHTGQAHRRSGDLSRAFDLFFRGYTLAAAIGDRLGMATALNNIGQTYISAGNFDTGLEFVQRALFIHRQLSHRLRRALCVFILGTGEFGRRNDSLAIRHLTAAWQQLTSEGDTQTAGYASIYLAESFRRDKKPQKAAYWAETAIQQFGPALSSRRNLALRTRHLMSSRMPVAIDLLRFGQAIADEGIDFSFALTVVTEAIEGELSHPQELTAASLIDRLQHLISAFQSEKRDVLS